MVSGAEALADAAQLASLADETPEGRSIVVLAKEKYGLRGRDVTEIGARFIPFSAETRMSGCDLDGRKIRKGAADAIVAYVHELGGTVSSQVEGVTHGISDSGGTPLVVAEGNKILGIIHLKDVVKGGISERFERFRAMGIRTVMITGDNPRTAAAIAREAGVDDFLAQATPEAKMRLIREEQAKGKLVAMTGDGTNDAPALAQADVGVAMNTGTQAAKEAGNMVDLDSNPTKLLEVVEIGKQMLMTRGVLDDFFHRQRRGQVFRHHSSHVHGCLSGDRAAQYNASGVAAKRDSFRGDFQRDHHHICLSRWRCGVCGTVLSARDRCWHVPC